MLSSRRVNQRHSGENGDCAAPSADVTQFSREQRQNYFVVVRAQ